ncbi:hypothetical protein ACFO4E_26150 [Nocardiopsis mangrovi]|uniref:Uncharacterized protein n=1 Tax=Nocardiopsis mangrovi TaxID=1179818 RepID=A0ABV9E3T1_9ACTN
MERCERREEAGTTCPGCGWPDSEVFEVVSRHMVSTGMMVYTRCPCGRLRARTVTVP